MNSSKAAVGTAVVCAATACVVAALIVSRRARNKNRLKRGISILRDFEDKCSTPMHKLRNVVDSLIVEMNAGLASEGGSKVKMIISDVFEYISESPFGLYGSILFMLSHSKEYTTGFFWLNAAEMQIDVLAPGWDGNSASDSDANADGIHTMWMAESGILDGFFFFFIGPGPKDVMRQYASLTGTSAMPQIFATAYHQCRWNYRDEEYVSNVDAKFDEFDIPYDLWLDIEHTDGKRYFTWDNLLFSNPEEMQMSVKLELLSTILA